MDPAGFEPASATVTECRVPLTLRALIGVSGTAEKMARLEEGIFSVALRIGKISVVAAP